MLPGHVVSSEAESRLRHTSQARTVARHDIWVARLFTKTTPTRTCNGLGCFLKCCWTTWISSGANANDCASEAVARSASTILRPFCTNEVNRRSRKLTWKGKKGRQAKCSVTMMRIIQPRIAFQPKSLLRIGKLQETKL